MIDAKVFSRKGQERGERTKAIEDQEKARLLKNQADEIRIIQNSTRRKVGKYLIGKRTAHKIGDEKKNRIYLRAKERIKEEHLLAIPFDRLKEIDVIEGKRFLLTFNVFSTVENSKSMWSREFLEINWLN